MFENNIIHRNIKPSKIFMHDNVIKLNDFRFSREMINPLEREKMSLIGTTYYAAPLNFFFFVKKV